MEKTQAIDWTAAEYVEDLEGFDFSADAVAFKAEVKIGECVRDVVFFADQEWVLIGYLDRTPGNPWDHMFVQYVLTGFDSLSQAKEFLTALHQSEQGLEFWLKVIPFEKDAN